MSFFGDVPREGAKDAIPPDKSVGTCLLVRNHPSGIRNDENAPQLRVHGVHGNGDKHVGPHQGDIPTGERSGTYLLPKPRASPALAHKESELTTGKSIHEPSRPTLLFGETPIPPVEPTPFSFFKEEEAEEEEEEEEELPASSISFRGCSSCLFGGCSCTNLPSFGGNILSLRDIPPVERTPFSFGKEEEEEEEEE